MSVVAPFAPARAADPKPKKEPRQYCVREGGIQEGIPDCIYVDRIEQVPKGAILIPSHGGQTDPEKIRRFWCLDGSGDEILPASEIPTECLRFFAQAHGGSYAKRLAAIGAAERPKPKLSFADVPPLHMTALDIDTTARPPVMRLPALELPFPR